MITEVLQGLYFLSNCPDPKQEADYLKKKLDYLQDPLKPWADAWVQNYQQYGVFPTFETYMAAVPGAAEYLASMNVNPEILGSFTKDLLGQYHQTWYQYLGSFEIRHLEGALREASSGDEKRKITDRIQSLLSRSTNVHDVVLDDCDIDVAGDIVRRMNAGTEGIVWPIDRLNEQLSPLQPGIVAGVFGNPGSGKSTFAQNMVYLNSVKSDRTSVYFYLEDTPNRYKMNILSRFSRDLDDEDLWLSASVMKRTLDKDHPDAPKIVETVTELQRRYDAEKQGRIIYQSMHGFSNDPIVFGPQLARYCDKYDVDFLVVDHILRFGGFRHPDYPRVEYLNLMMGCLANVAIGQYGNKPLAVMPIAQPNREGEGWATKTKGHFRITDISDISAMEKDSMIVLAVHSDETMRQINEINTLVLKARDGGADSQPVPSYFDPRYSVIASTGNTDGETSGPLYDLDQVWAT